jgi:hypothetical protein
MKRKIKVSHEVPFCLLNYSREFNDYDYCLPHLLDQNEEYKAYFLQAKAEGRYIVMDNSLHELGTAYDTARLLHWINVLEPDEFMVPDVWEDKTASIVNARAWSKTELPEGVTKVAVVQAKSFSEALECTHIYKELGYKKIAYSYGASYYNEIVDHPNKNLGKALGRVKVITDLYKNGILTSYDRVHLLGCQVPQEFAWYQGIECIESIDTSNPIMAALEGEAYNFYGLTNKPKANMNDYQDIATENVDLDLVDNNVEMFRLINNI